MTKVINIWILWFQGINSNELPFLNKECINAWEKLNKNNLNFKVNVLDEAKLYHLLPEIKEIFNNSKNLYKMQNINFENESLIENLNEFFTERFKIILKDLDFRLDIINSIVDTNGCDDIYGIFSKIKTFDNLLKQNSGKTAVSVY